MNTFLQRFAVAALVVCFLGFAPTDAQAAPKKALILYDYQATQPFGKLGKIYAIMLSNLLGHFKVQNEVYQVVLKPIQNYAAGEIDGTPGYDATFYIGSYYDNPLPPAFLSDVMATQRTVVWFKYNLWKLAWDPTFDFAGRYGLAFDGVRGLDAAPSPTSPNSSFFNTVLYKGQSLVKYYSYDPATNTVNADPEIGVTHVVDPAKAQPRVFVENGGTAEQVPYIVQAGNFWYVADVPFSYIGPRDRYLVICDVLHDILGVQQPESHLGLVRLEDVGALVDETAMKTLTDYLDTQQIPFSIAAIPFYRDPLGAYNGGTPQQIHFADPDALSLRNSLTYALARRGRIVMHGYTHQYNNVRNPHTGVSGDDFEFWNIVANTPVTGDSQARTRQRLTAGLAELSSASSTGEFAPFAWEVPHYHASPVASKTFATAKNALGQPLFPTTYHRVVYFTSDTGSLSNGEFLAGQFFPYVIYRDYYGQRILPEGLGNIEYDISSQCDPSSNVVYTADDLLLNANRALIVRDGSASFFFHPFWLEDLSGCGVPAGTGFADFKKVVEGVTALGYTWVDPSTVQ